MEVPHELVDQAKRASDLWEASQETLRHLFDNHQEQ